MQLNLSDQEKDLLMDLLQSAYTTTLHELHHTHSHEFKELLRVRIGLIERLQNQLTLCAA